MEKLKQRKIELENKIDEFKFTLLPIQTIKRDMLIKELKEVQFKIFIGEHGL